jgi:hypothetical protein
MKFCTCKYPKEVEVLHEIKTYTLEGGTHTSFMIFECQLCHEPVFFPHENFEIAIEQGTEETKKIIIDLIGERI